jgi:hypothetical protein
VIFQGLKICIAWSLRTSGKVWETGADPSSTGQYGLGSSLAPKAVWTARASPASALGAAASAMGVR